MIQLTHTAAHGSLVEGTTRGDGSAPILKANGWRWSRGLAAWYLPQSRDREPRVLVLERTRDQLADAGLEVSLGIDYTQRPTEEVERDREERAQARAERLGRRAVADADAAAAAEERGRRISAGIPLGQPLLIGHHSERRHRRDIGRIHQSIRQSIEAEQRSAENARRAELAATESDRRRNPLQVARRITDLEREQRRIRRSIEGYTRGRELVPPAAGDHAARLERELAGTTEQLEYWQRVRQAQVDEGLATDYSREVIDRGDSIEYRGSWYEVVRANPKSVSVRSRVGGNWTDTIPYTQITGHRPRP